MSTLGMNGFGSGAISIAGGVTGDAAAGSKFTVGMTTSGCVFTTSPVDGVCGSGDGSSPVVDAVVSTVAVAETA